MSPNWRSLSCLFVQFWAVSSVLAGTDRSAMLQDVTVVHDGEGSARVLFRAAEIPFSDQMLIQRATLKVPYTGDAAERSLDLRLHLVSEAWPQGGEFETEFDPDLYAPGRADLHRGPGTVAFDVTVLLKEMLEEGTFADGFVLTTGSKERTGIADEDVSRFGSLFGAELTVTTMMVPSGRIPRGVDRQ